MEKVKNDIAPSFSWYPYGTLNNFVHLKEIFNKYPLKELTRINYIADIGAADGDLAFFIRSLGFNVDIVDYAPTNYNGLKGARAIIETLQLASYVQVLEMDIDNQFTLPSGKKYDLVFLLGILYHLKNPFYILEKLSQATTHLVLSTRVARYATDGRYISGLPVAYLLDQDESNNDATNYWIFSESALMRIVSRAGWTILYSKTVGDTITSNPFDTNKDERCFMLLRSKHAAESPELSGC